MRRLVLPLCLALLVCTSPCLATTYLVNPDGSGDFPTIQAAVDDATEGDVIELGNGAFVGEGNRKTTFREKTLSFRSVSGDPALCSLDLDGYMPSGFKIVGPVMGWVEISGITIRNGIAENGPGIMGLHINLRMNDCVFEDNVSQNHGGALVLGGYTQAEIEDCVFDHNIAVRYDGGAVLCYNYTTATFRRCTFSGNACNRSGGAIHSNHLLTVEDCEFIGNAILVSTQFSGGGVYCSCGPNLIEGCTFVGNRAPAFGGGLGIFDCGETSEVRGCTFYRNVAPYGGGIVHWGGDVVIEQTIVANSQGGEALASYYSTLDIICCDFHNNEGGDWVGPYVAPFLGVAGNIAEPPLFCDPTGGDFALDEASPCAPFSPPNPECDLIGAWPVECGTTPPEEKSWGQIKNLYR